MTPFRRTISRVLAWWLAYRVERRNPQLAALRKVEAERRAKHAPVRDIHKTRRAIVHERLANELRRTA